MVKEKKDSFLSVEINFIGILCLVFLILFAYFIITEINKSKELVQSQDWQYISGQSMYCQNGKCIDGVKFDNCLISNNQEHG